MEQDLRNIWKQGKESVSSAASADEIIKTARSKKRSVLYSHLGNILILTITLAGLLVFFNTVARFKETLSNVGVALMSGALALRITIEVLSILKSNAIKFSDDTKVATKTAHSFYAFRKKVHGTVTIIIVGLYIAGFYALTPEFSIYISLKWMIAMHLSFISGGIFLIWVIRKGIRKEMLDLAYLTKLRQEIDKDENTVTEN